MTRSNVSQKFIQQLGEIIKNTEKLLHSYTVIRCVSIIKKQTFQAIKLNPLARISRIQVCTGEAYQKNFTKSSYVISAYFGTYVYKITRHCKSISPHENIKPWCSTVA